MHRDLQNANCSGIFLIFTLLDVTLASEHSSFLLNFKQISLSPLLNITFIDPASSLPQTLMSLEVSLSYLFSYYSALLDGLMPKFHLLIFQPNIANLYPMSFIITVYILT